MAGIVSVENNPEDPPFKMISSPQGFAYCQRCVPLPNSELEAKWLSNVVDFREAMKGCP
jgi:hypothetical protein